MVTRPLLYRPLCIAFAVAAILCLGTSTSLAQGRAMEEDRDGELLAYEYEVISPNGSITRSFCPYTCEDRDLPRERCREWQSKLDPQKCYVQDLALPSNAIRFSTAPQVETARDTTLRSHGAAPTR